MNRVNAFVMIVAPVVAARSVMRQERFRYLTASDFTVPTVCRSFVADGVRRLAALSAPWEFHNQARVPMMKATTDITTRATIEAR
jgi:hypothetical protein